MTIIAHGKYICMTKPAQRIGEKHWDYCCKTSTFYVKWYNFKLDCDELLKVFILTLEQHQRKSRVSGYKNKH